MLDDEAKSRAIEKINILEKAQTLLTKQNSEISRKIK